MSKTNIKILLFLAAVAILGLTYLYVFKTNIEDAESIQSEVDTLQVRYDDLKAKEKDRDMYIAETERLNGLFEERLAYFPATLDQEISVMFIKGVEKDEGNLQFGVNSVGLGQPETFYSLGAAVASTTGTDGDNTPVADGYQCMTAAFPIQYQGSYEGLKDFMDYIMAYKYRMNISAININYDSVTDLYSGTVSLNAYCVTGGGREADTVDVDVPEGVDNLFLGGDGAAVVSSSGHDADNGAGIADDHDILVGLNNANGDSSDGIIVSAGSNRVSSTANSIETVDLKIAEEDGKNQVTVTLGDDSYSFELSDKELTIYVESSKRVDSDDKNGIKLNVVNDTDVAVFVKVADDDSSAPRFALGSKTGTVKVY
ncbi:MAG: hypothetical protein ACI4L2_10375 [Wujia sp.]